MRLNPLLGLAVATLALGAGCSGATETTSDSGTTGGGSSTGASGGSGSGGASSGGSSSGGSSSGGSSSGGGSAYQCSGDGSEFDSFGKSCTSTSDCVLVNHTSSCCGDGLRMAINASEQQRFSTVESYCSAQLPACGCAAQGVSAEDGTMVPFGSENLIVAECTDGVCNSRYGGSTFQCADQVCTESEYCTITTGGPVGSVSSGSCTFDGGCTECACASTPIGCQCSEQGGNVTISCALP